MRGPDSNRAQGDEEPSGLWRTQASTLRNK
jgi:hypothetical protein